MPLGSFIPDASPQQPPIAAHGHAAHFNATAPSSSPTPIWARAAARPRRWPTSWPITTASTLFLVGDIVDGWQLKRRWFWTEAQSEVVAEILRKVDDGTRVIFVPGNHDEFARDYAGRLFAGIEIINEAIHETADGKRLWVLHGDRFDGVIAFAKWLAHVGDWAYGVALRLNDLLFTVRKALGPALLVAVGLAQAQGQERGRIYLPLRGNRGARKPPRAASTAWSAAISTMPKSAASATSSTSTTETGLKAAAPLSKMPADIWRFFAGPILPQRRAPRAGHAASLAVAAATKAAPVPA